MLFSPAAVTAAGEINTVLDLPMASSKGRAAGCTGNGDTNLRCLHCWVQPERSGKTKGFCGCTARGDAGGWQGGRWEMQGFSISACQCLAGFIWLSFLCAYSSHV